MMNGWKRVFGLDPVDMVIHLMVASFLVAALGEATRNDTVALLTAAAGLLAYAWRRQRALGTMAATGLTSGEVKLAELDAQAEELHELRGRMAELEERLDFTERLLAQQREPEQLPRGG